MDGPVHERPAEDDPVPARRPDASPGRPEWLVGAEDAWASEARRLPETEPGTRAPKLPTFPPPVREQPPEPIAAGAPAQTHGHVPPNHPLADEEPADWLMAGSGAPPAHPEVEVPAEAGQTPLAAGSGGAAQAAGGKSPVLPGGEGETERAPTPSLWDGALHRIRTHRPTQLIAVAAGLLLVLILSTVHGASAVPLSRIKRNPQSFDGRSVTVRGRVGEVFPVGSSYAYYLYQGHDSIVVFTRSRAPIPHQKLAVTGSVSTGFLEGVPRPALFEESH